MAAATKRTLNTVKNLSDDVSEPLKDQIAALRREIASISEAVSDYGGHGLNDLQHNALALAKDMRHRGVSVARRVNKQAHVAGKTLQDNPVPVIVALGTIALLSALIFGREER